MKTQYTFIVNNDTEYFQHANHFYTLGYQWPNPHNAGSNQFEKLPIKLWLNPNAMTITFSIETHLNDGECECKLLQPKQRTMLEYFKNLDLPTLEKYNVILERGFYKLDEIADLNTLRRYYLESKTKLKSNATNT